MKRKLQILVLALGLGLGMLGMALLAPASHAPAIAAPPAAPTPITAPAVSNARQLFTPATSKVIAADYNTDAMEISTYSWADFEYITDQGTATNTITLTVQFSNDKSNWVNGPNLLANSSTDASDLTRLPTFGQYMRVSADVANTNSVTVTLSALAR